MMLFLMAMATFDDATSAMMAQWGGGGAFPGLPEMISGPAAIARVVAHQTGVKARCC
jgi:hypothetical protein